MSYADQASKGPKQSAEDARAPIPPQVENKTSAPGVDIDVDKAKSQASDALDSTKQKASNAGAYTEEKSSETSQTLREKAGEAADYSKQKSHEFSKEASKDYDRAKREAIKDGKKFKEGVKGEYDEIYENRDNPVVIANGVALVVGSIALAYGGYQKYQVGELDWKLAGTAGVAVGLLGVGDYFLSQWLFNNKYPKK